MAVNLLVDAGVTAEGLDVALEWLDKSVFVSVGERAPGAVVYETYLVA
jgi:hypothetical protein